MQLHVVGFGQRVQREGSSSLTLAPTAMTTVNEHRLRRHALLDQIRESVNKGLALGNDLKDEIETLYGRRLRPAKMGRPKKSLI